MTPVILLGLAIVMAGARGRGARSRIRSRSGASDDALSQYASAGSQLSRGSIPVSEDGSQVYPSQSQLDDLLGPVDRSESVSVPVTTPATTSAPGLSVYSDAPRELVPLAPPAQGHVVELDPIRVEAPAPAPPAPAPAPARIVVDTRQEHGGALVPDGDSADTRIRAANELSQIALNTSASARGPMRARIRELQSTIGVTADGLIGGATARRIFQLTGVRLPIRF